MLTAQEHWPNMQAHRIVQLLVAIISSLFPANRAVSVMVRVAPRHMAELSSSLGRTTPASAQVGTFSCWLSL